MNLQEELLERKRAMLVELEKKRSSNEILWNGFYEMIRTKLREEFQKHPYGDSVEILLDQDSTDKDYVYQGLIRDLTYGGESPKFLQSFLEFASQEGIIVSIDRSKIYPRIKCKMLINHKEIEQRRINTDILLGHIKNEFSINYYLQKEASKDYTKLIDYDENIDISYFIDTCKGYQIDVSVKPDYKVLRNFKDKDYADYKLFLKVDEKDIAQWSDLRYILEVIIDKTEKYAKEFLDPYHYTSRTQKITYLGGISDELLATVSDDCVGDYKNLVVIEDQIIDADYYKELLEKGGYSLSVNSTKKVLSISRKKNV